MACPRTASATAARLELAALLVESLLGSFPDIVVHGAFYTRLPKWEEVTGGAALAGTAPHDIERLFFGHGRMESPGDRFDFAVDVTGVDDVKQAALMAYESMFGGDQAMLLGRYDAEDRCVGSLVGLEYAEAFEAPGPLLVLDPTVFLKVRYG